MLGVAPLRGIPQASTRRCSVNPAAFVIAVRGRSTSTKYGLTYRMSRS
jgi:hypothetical protein